MSMFPRIECSQMMPMPSKREVANTTTDREEVKQKLEVLFMTAAKIGNMQGLNTLRNNPSFKDLSSNVIEEAFVNAFRGGHSEAVQLLASDSRISKDLIKKCFAQAAEQGSERMIKALQDFYPQEIFIEACNQERVKLVTLLKDHPNISPIVVSGQFGTATDRGMRPVADILKDHPSINPHVIEEMFKEACRQGKPVVVNYLLSHSLLKEETIKGEFSLSLFQGHGPIADLLTHHPKITPAFLREVHQKAVQEKHAAVLQRLSTYPKLHQ